MRGLCSGPVASCSEQTAHPTTRNRRHDVNGCPPRHRRYLLQRRSDLYAFVYCASAVGCDEHGAISMRPL